eukprot:6480674-Amphidinium_carterae.1
MCVNLRVNNFRHGMVDVARILVVDKMDELVPSPRVVQIAPNVRLWDEPSCFSMHMVYGQNVTVAAWLRGRWLREFRDRWISTS